MSRQLAADLLADFAAEARERLDRLEELLLSLPGAMVGARPEILGDVQLELHTLKGNAGMMGLTAQQVLAHELEDQTADMDLDAPQVEALLAGVDRFRSLLANAHPGAASAGAASAGSALPADALADSVRIPFSTLDALVNQLAEVVIVRNRLAAALGDVQPLLPQGSHLGELGTAWDQLAFAHDRLGTTLDQLQASVLNLRMVPLASLFRPLTRIVHDTSAEQGKEVLLETSGADTPLDKALIEVASDALGHLVRNAVIHGIESPAVRRAAGKPAAGRLRLSAVASPREVQIDLIDDGQGVDRQAVLAAAARRGFPITPGEDPLRLLFLAGLSTRSEADLGAGRGIGLAAVRDSVERHGGRIDVASRPGSGTHFRLHLPLSASITRALLLLCDAEDYALPLRAVVETVHLTPGALHEMNSATVLTWRGGVLPALDLGFTFGTARQRRLEGYAVVVEEAGRQRALLVDVVQGIREIVVKGLDPVLGAPPGIGGTTILGDGRAVLILDPVSLMALSPAQPQGAPAGTGVSR